MLGVLDVGGIDAHRVQGERRSGRTAQACVERDGAGDLA